ncbi:hypothetical protein EVAR_79846_1 [Eumeta japonica]|uniref:Uncharacterized protein n=1 Tax=Eumeta variegata TaxID=151549 RepID=A0A4C1TZ13_EUMVA|nr:hypothetical protein EVAR_79846_1 [Eumeta japonica]
MPNPLGARPAHAATDSHSRMTIRIDVSASRLCIRNVVRSTNRQPIEVSYGTRIRETVDQRSRATFSIQRASGSMLHHRQESTNKFYIEAKPIGKSFRKPFAARLGLPHGGYAAVDLQPRQLLALAPNTSYV